MLECHVIVVDSSGWLVKCLPVCLLCSEINDLIRAGQVAVYCTGVNVDILLNSLCLHCSGNTNPLLARQSIFHLIRTDV